VAKRRARAARFGVPFVEPKVAEVKPQKAKAGKPANTAVPNAKKTATAVVPAPPVDETTLKKRADRFGIQKPASAAAPAVAQVVDPVEEEKKRKRAERFGAAQPAEKKAKVGTLA